MQITKVDFSAFKAKGELMFGNTDNTTWEREYPSEHKGNCNWALRSLLVEHGDAKILIDSGFGNSNPDILDEYEVDEFQSSKKILNSLGKKPDEISHVLHTHLHLDHCGGSFLKDENDNITPSFQNATYYCGNQQLNTAKKPTDFEKDSFQREIVSAFSNYGNLKLLKNECFLFPWLEILIFNGHTIGMTLPVIHTPKYSLAFVGDLLPSIAHLRLQITMSYDINQVLSLTERENFLEDAYENEYILFFQHDYFYECCTLKKEKSRILPAEIFKFSDL